MRSDFKNNIKNRIGETKIMNCGEECEIIEYRNTNNITVKFINTGELVECAYKNFKIGTIKSRFTPSVYGVGIVGLGKTKENGESFKSYITWYDMLKRCYDEKLHKSHSTYKNCKVCKEWLFYPNFKKWYENNYYEIDNQRMELDKDILKKGNKTYSPENCIFVPHNINSLFTKKGANRGNLPIGVSWHKEANKYISRCNILDMATNKPKNKYLGLYDTSIEAFGVYKKAKEENIKLIADYYKDKIPSKLYEAMCKYEVHIED